MWGYYLGSPGSLKDINRLDSSPLITDVLQGRMIPNFEEILTAESIANSILLSMELPTLGNFRIDGFRSV